MPMMRLLRSYEMSIKSSLWKPSLLFVNLNGLTSTLPSVKITKVKRLSMAISMSK